MAQPPWGRSPDALPSFRGLGGDPGEVRSTPRSRFCRSCASRVRGAGHEFFPGVTAPGRRSAADVRVSFLRRARTHVCLSSPSSRQSCRAPRPTWSSPTSALAPPRSSSDRATTGRRPSPGGSWKGRCVRSSRPRAGLVAGAAGGRRTWRPCLAGSQRPGQLGCGGQDAFSKSCVSCDCSVALLVVNLSLCLLGKPYRKDV